MCACMCLCLCTHLGKDTRFATVLSGSLLVIQLTWALDFPQPRCQCFLAQILNLLMIKTSLSSCFTGAHQGKSCSTLVLSYLQPAWQQNFADLFPSGKRGNKSPRNGELKASTLPAGVMCAVWTSPWSLL